MKFEPEQTLESAIDCARRGANQYNWVVQKLLEGYFQMKDKADLWDKHASGDDRADSDPHA